MTERAERPVALWLQVAYAAIGAALAAAAAHLWLRAARPAD